MRPPDFRSELGYADTGQQVIFVLVAIGLLFALHTYVPIADSILFVVLLGLLLFRWEEIRYLIYGR